MHIHCRCSNVVQRPQAGGMVRTTPERNKISSFRTTFQISVTNVMALLLSTVVLGMGGSAQGDCGSIPYSAPWDIRKEMSMVLEAAGEADVNFDPLKVVVYEPGQRGIILWNGKEEILLLSTEIKTSQPSSILEVIPFPTEPTVKLGDFETFEKMQRLLIDKSMWQVASGGGVANVTLPDDVADITFSKKMGAHNVTVVRVIRPDYFAEWVMKFLREQKAIKPQIDPRFLDVINAYLERRYNWFVFDTILATNDLQSKEPIEYRFESKNVYYPLQISTLETGKTKVDLLLLTQEPVSSYNDLQFAVKREKGVSVTPKELKSVSKDWADFMGTADFTMQRVYIHGNLSDMQTDFIVR